MLTPGATTRVRVARKAKGAIVMQPDFPATDGQDDSDLTCMFVRVSGETLKLGVCLTLRCAEPRVATDGGLARLKWVVLHKVSLYLCAFGATCPIRAMSSSRPYSLNCTLCCPVQAVEGQRTDFLLQPCQHGTNCLPHPQPRLGTQIDDLAVKTAQSPHPLNAGDGILIRDKEAQEIMFSGNAEIAIHGDITVFTRIRLETHAKFHTPQFGNTDDTTAVWGEHPLMDDRDHVASRNKRSGGRREGPPARRGTIL